jgi:hypothetical protein
LYYDEKDKERSESGEWTGEDTEET